MRPLFRILPALLFAGLMFAQAPKAPSKAKGTPPPPPPPTVVREDGLYGTIRTSMGAVVLKMFEKESPIAVKNFMGLAMGGKAWTDPKTNRRTTRAMYPGTIFHRVIPDFMIQGGDPTGTGNGGTDVIKDEFDPSLKFDTAGRLAMANAGPGTGSCQFFITEKPTAWLDGKHTIFGQVIEGQDVVESIARVPRDTTKNRPNTPVKIEKITFERWAAGKLAPLTPRATAAPKKAGAATKAAPAPKTAPAAKK